VYNWRTVAILVAWAAAAEGRSEVPFQVRLGPAEVGEVLLQGCKGGVLARHRTPELSVSPVGPDATPLNNS
jgi:hypothetical protein